MRLVPSLLTTIVLTGGLLAFTAPAVEKTPEKASWTAQTFDKLIAPLLARRCLDCHGGAKPKGGLDLTRRQSAIDGGNKGPAIVPGKSADSLLWQHVFKGAMPPKKPLPDEEKAIFKAWIDAGAIWGSDPIDPFRITTEHRAGYDWWSLQPLPKVEPPAVKQSSWVRNPIDRFVLAKLEEKGLKPSPPAEPRVLVRRLYFDLLGLPPSPEEVEAFVRDPSEKAFGELVDRLLASPQFGERWARHWLDVVRYGESDGFERNMPRLSAWPYRDWVVDALNNDMPYDQFTRLQIAGDVIHPDDAGAVAATGFLVAGIHNTVLGQNDFMQQTARQDELEDILATLGQSFLGLTVHCARCHDHKFDPVSQKDYYRLTAALAGVAHGERGIAPQGARKKQTEAGQSLAAVDSEIAGIEKEAYERFLSRNKQTPKNDKPITIAPMARWTFARDGRDQIGSLHGELKGGAVIADGRLKLNGRDAYMMTAPLARDLHERTLEAWVSLSNLDQGGGGVITLEMRNGQVFDSIVYGERQRRRWISGSNAFQRTRDLDGAEEVAQPGQLIHMAVVYSGDGRVAVYRNGKPYADPYMPAGAGAAMQLYKAGETRVLLGLRHHGGGKPFLAGEIAEARLYDRVLSARDIEASAKSGPGAGFLATAELLAELTQAQKKRRDALLAEKETLKQALAAIPGPRKIFAVTPRIPGPTFLLARGDVQKKLDKLSAGAVLALSDQRQDFGLSIDAPEGERRVKLAEWVTAQPLFARIAVNRLWHHHFGAGIVETPSDFGFNGARPSHPELLDWLAGELVRQKFQMKSLHRLMVMSSTYRQASATNPQAVAVDAHNRLLWRKHPLRLEAEALRDAILVVSGQLNPRRGGPGYKDTRNYHNNGTTYYEPIDPVGPDFNRRTLYRFSPRGERSALLDTFDCPDPSAATPRRQVTTTPLQALALLNSSFVLRLADNLAQRVEADVKGPKSDMGAKVNRAYLLVFTRAATAEELRLSVPFASKHGLAALCRVLFNSSEFVVID